MKLSSPWVNFYNEINALFGNDPEISVRFDEEGPKIDLYVDNARKADALTRLLPTEKDFGNVKLTINVIPADAEQTKLDLIQEAFYNNPALSYVWQAATPFGEFDYVVFKNEVVQYYNDNIRDINGNKSTLYEDIARDVFGEDANLCFCTEAKNRELSKPLGEWP